jgi:DNA-directed RNA polymerase sigma subunit (sigma70/sigma32)
MKMSVRRLDPDRQAELDELLAALTAAETLAPDDPVVMYILEIAALESLPPDREADLLAAIRDGDEAARHRLTELNLWKVIGIARQFIGRAVPFLDLVQEGNLGLVRAVAEVPVVQGSFGDLRDARIREAIERAFD